MARWEPGATARLQKAALELFTSQGFEQTTAAEIAQAVGLNRRTFFRHFPDKRDVLFLGQQELEGALVAAVAQAPAGESPMSLIGFAIARVADMFADTPREHARARQTIIDTNAALLERQHHKNANLAQLLRDALRDQGIAEPAATLAAESAVTVFNLAFRQWLATNETRTLSVIAAETLAELRALDVRR
ncbi:TetR family transcriptional regulator [Nocardia sp. NPDC049707]|uniref:TetR family transcriptional regulator n=1 Tax=Nocardia sp. NPDC049707 TaxID=3154735 RepID=UPI00342074F1